MCELFAISARRPTTVSFSLARFAARGGLNGKTLDGWGLAYYAARDLHLFREPEPANGSPWLKFIETREKPSTLVVSHIRQATRGGASLANTQPFAREIAGAMHVFAHNGMLRGIEDYAQHNTSRFTPIGETDSELAACVVFEKMAALWDATPEPTIAARLEILARFAADIRQLGPANFLYCDSRVLFAHGHRRTQSDGRIEPPGLWVLNRTCAVDSAPLAAAGVALNEPADSQEVFLIASVPLTSEPWRPLYEGEMIAVCDGQIVSAHEP